MSITKLYTADDLVAMGSDAPFELIEGELRRVAASYSRSSEIGVNVLAPLHRFVRERKLGRVTGESGGYIVSRDPDTVLAPDVGFVAAARAHSFDDRGYCPFAPDLAVEVMSTSDRLIDLERKAKRYIDGGTRLVWVVRPDRSTVTVFAPGRDPVVIGPNGELDGEDVVPGFRLPLAEVFA